MAALASYAKQSEDETLMKLAMRIRARAVRRCGELLKTFQNQGARTELMDASGHKLTQERVGGCPCATKEEVEHAL
jgi:hypothetical protein